METRLIVAYLLIALMMVAVVWSWAHVAKRRREERRMRSGRRIHPLD